MLRSPRWHRHEQREQAPTVRGRALYRLSDSVDSTPAGRPANFGTKDGNFRLFPAPPRAPWRHGANRLFLVHSIDAGEWSLPAVVTIGWTPRLLQSVALRTRKTWSPKPVLYSTATELAGTRETTGFSKENTRRGHPLPGGSRSSLLVVTTPVENLWKIWIT
jgi:hypothetical protein